jgi:DNA repair protein RadA
MSSCHLPNLLSRYSDTAVPDRIYLRKSGENRVAKMMDSPYHPYSDTRFTINEKGADDMEEDALSKRLSKKASKAASTTTDDS